jgi:hypothetical protein
LPKWYVNSVINARHSYVGLCTFVEINPVSIHSGNTPCHSRHFRCVAGRRLKKERNGCS